MDETEQRHIARDSLFVMADLWLDGSDEAHRIKMRNLSAGGMMGEGTVRVSRGAVVRLEIRNIGRVDGSVAWVQDNRFGVAFNEDIDPKLARPPLASNPASDPTPSHVRHALDFAKTQKIYRQV